ncbi:19037_t:CDS:2 [Dentiscutata erythropus]|uniref:19037_t:CDS:1 n=1 Tax=Dentiscutata erythropus TaxID=1348616 RepID=A0A9N9CY30_9GLOM|nr:19037_t:CDS:2 [Dentiscutata erythropus]
MQLQWMSYLKVLSDVTIGYKPCMTVANDEVRPQLIIAGYSSYSLQIDFAKFRQIADEVGVGLLRFI